MENDLDNIFNQTKTLSEIINKLDKLIINYQNNNVDIKQYKNIFKNFYIKVFNTYNILDSDNISKTINIIKLTSDINEIEYDIYKNHKNILDTFNNISYSLINNININNNYYDDDYSYDINKDKYFYKKILYKYIDMVLFINGFYKYNNNISNDLFSIYYNQNKKLILTNILMFFKYWVFNDDNKNNDEEIINYVKDVMKYLYAENNYFNSLEELISYRRN